MTRRHVTVALSGDGGDEAFAGYTFRYLPHAHEARIRERVPAALRSAVFGAAAAVWPSSARLPRPLRLKTILGNLAQGDAEAFYRDLAWLRDETRRAVYAPDFRAGLRGFSARETVIPLYASSDAPEAVGRAQHTDMQLYMTDDVLAKVDRMSMAHSLEVRCPLLDPAILEFAARLPASVRMSGSRGKLPLRRLAERRLPKAVVDAPKRGFAPPVAQWLRNDLRPMAEAARRLGAARALVVSGHVGDDDSLSSDPGGDDDDDDDYRGGGGGGGSDGSDDEARSSSQAVRPTPALHLALALCALPATRWDQFGLYSPRAVSQAQTRAPKAYGTRKVVWQANTRDSFIQLYGLVYWGILARMQQTLERARSGSITGI
jgi:hypothetical protein